MKKVKSISLENKDGFIAHVRQSNNGQWLIHDLYEHCEEAGAGGEGIKWSTVIKRF